MIIDCTPALVNKTAIFRIIREAIKQLTKYQINFQLKALGKDYADWEEIERETELPIVFNLLLRLPKIVLPMLNIFNLLRPNIEKQTIVYFDPLYVLFNNLKDSDFVFVLDLSPFTIPAFHPPPIAWLYHHAFKKLQGSRCKLISISHSTTIDLRVNLGIRPDRIQQVRLFANPELAKLGAQPKSCPVLPKKFLLFVGSLETRKNIRGLIEGFEASNLLADNLHLVIVGRMGFGGTDVLHLIQAIPHVHWLGAVADHELAWYFENALGFVYPSFWEGFGVPLLEALKYECPCLCTDSGASPEIGGKSVLYCDPCDIKSIAEGIKGLVKVANDKDMKNALLKDKEQILENFSTESFGKDLANIFLRFEDLNDKEAY